MSRFKLAEKFGYDPPLKKRTQNPEEGIYDGKINYQELADYLNSCGRFLYNYKDFISKEEASFDTSVRSVISIDLFSVGVDVPLITRENGRDYKVQISGELNKKEGSVSIRQGKVFFSFKINKNKEIEYTKKIRYEFSDETAIKLTTTNYYDHVALSNYIRTKDNESVKALITRKFKQVFTHAENDIELLKWLYEQAPQFVLKERGDDKLINDLLKLVSYDKDGWLSWFRDASSEILKLLLGFNDIKNLYDYFHDNPEKIVETYSILDTYSKQQFAQLLDVISIPLTRNKERITDAKFYVGGTYSLNSNLSLEDNQKEILLENYHVVFPHELNKPLTYENKLPRKIITNQQYLFHPLDLVTMIDDISGEEKVVTAMHVKTLSDKKEWEAIVSTTVIVVSIIAILVSAGTLSAGATGYVAIIATIELVVGSLDLLKELLDSSDKEYSGAIQWFIDNWDYLSGAYGVISITSVIRSGIIKHGPKVLARIRSLPNSKRVLNLRSSIQALLTSIKIEFYFASRLGITFCKFLPFPSVIKIVGKNFAKKMQKFAVSIIEPIEGDSNIKGLIYAGEKIAEGDTKHLKAVLGDIFPYAAKDIDILKYLNELVESRKLDDYINSLKFKFNELGYRFTHTKKVAKDGVLDITMYLFDNNGQKLFQGLSEISKGKLSNYFDVTIQKNEVSTAMYKLLDRIGFEKVEGVYIGGGSISTNYDEFMKVYLKTNDAYQAAYNTPAGKALNNALDNSFKPDIDNIIIDDVNEKIILTWIKK